MEVLGSKDVVVLIFVMDFVEAVEFGDMHQSMGCIKAKITYYNQLKDHAQLATDDTRRGRCSVYPLDRAG